MRQIPDRRGASAEITKPSRVPQFLKYFLKKGVFHVQDHMGTGERLNMLTRKGWALDSPSGRKLLSESVHVRNIDNYAQALEVGQKRVEKNQRVLRPWQIWNLLGNSLTSPCSFDV